MAVPNSALVAQVLLGLTPVLKACAASSSSNSFQGSQRPGERPGRRQLSFAPAAEDIYGTPGAAEQGSPAPQAEIQGPQAQAGSRGESWPTSICTQSLHE